MIPSLLRVCRAWPILATAVVVFGFLIGRPAAAIAQAGTVTGTVFERRSSRPLVAATVRAEGTDIVATTDSRGQFVLRGLSGATARVTAARVGFEPQTVEVSIGGPTVRIELDELAVKPDELIVTGTPGEAASRSLGNAIAKVNISANVEVAPPV